MPNTRTVLLWHNNGVERIYFTVNPAQLTISRPNDNRVVALAMGGTMNLWGGRGLREVRLTTFLPDESSPFYQGSAPGDTLALLKRWQDSGDPVRLILSDSDINDAFLIEDVSETLREGDRDVGVSITLREYKFRSALAAAAAGGTVAGTAAASRPDERVTPASYTVKRGDTLWAIAAKYYGDGRKWGTIAAKNGISNPRTLQIGRVLTL